MRGLKYGLFVPLLIRLMCSAQIAWAVDNIEQNYPGAFAGDWSQGGTVNGPPDDSCVNVGAVGKANLLYSFGFSIPDAATIVGIRVSVKA